MILESCLAVAIFFEARDQSIDGQMAVGEVVINRVEDPRWPDDICGVVNQSKQFSFTHDGKHDDPTRHTNHDDVIAWETAQQVADDLMAGERIFTTEVNHYHTLSVSPRWRHRYQVEGQIQDHIFYRDK